MFKRIQANSDQWFKAFKEGNPSSCDIIYDKHSMTMYRFAYKILRNHEDAQDAVMVTFWKLWDNRSSIEDPDHLFRWLRMVTFRSAVDIVRKNERSIHVELDDSVLNNSQAGSDDALIREAFLRRIDEEVAGLPEKIREAFVMRYFKDMEYHEIARALNLTENSAAKYASNALVTLRLKLVGQNIDLIALSLFLLISKHLMTA
jgi:RNA polymerase sigma-70 factor (ECF subfamily)